MNIVLCGMMGCGKTTVSRAIAGKFACECLDTDALISEKYGEINSIFSTHGEEYFRDLETECLQGLKEVNNAVLSVGGGLVLRKKNVEVLKQWGKIVYLRAEKETLLKRLAGDTTRPLLQGEALSVRLDKLIAERGNAYESVCDFSVSVDDKSPMEIADEIIELVNLKGAGIE